MEQTKKEGNIKAAKDRKRPVSVYNFTTTELPQASEKSYEGWITYGERNLFPQGLIESWLQSSLHNALTTGISQMIAGAGITFSAFDAEVDAFTNKINRHGETLEDLIEKTAFDLYLHGYFGWQLVWNQQRTKVVEIYHTPAEQIRSGPADENGTVGEYFVSWDWSKHRKKEFAPTKIPAYNPTDRSAPRQMLFTKQYRPNQYYYSTPSYFGGLAWITLDIKVAEFHLNNIENGFFPSSIIQFFNGDPTQEEKREIELNFMNKFTGTGSAKLVFVYNNNRDEQVDFQTYEPANLDKRFKELIPEIQKNIMVSHRVPSPLMFGIRESTGLGNNAEELESSSVLMNKMVVIPFQQLILDQLAMIFKLNGWPVEVTIETLQPAQFLEGDKGDAQADTALKASFAHQGKHVLPSELIHPTIKHLSQVGEKREDLEADGWVLIQEDERLTTEGIKLRLRPLPDTFGTSSINSDPEEPSTLDKGLYKIRYEYRGPDDSKNRDFCGVVLDLGLIYRFEDINEMSAEGANAEDFGYYNIFDYKGSYGCRHRWHRLVFFRKRTPQGRFLPGEGLENDKLVGPAATPGDVVPLEAVDGKATKVNPRPT